jgi:hypothetical protein
MGIVRGYNTTDSMNACHRAGDIYILVVNTLLRHELSQPVQLDIVIFVRQLRLLLDSGSNQR